MHILYLNPVGILGGAEHALLTAIAQVRAVRPGARLTLVAGADGPLAARAAALGARVVVLPLPAGLRRAGDSHLRGRSAPARAAALAGAAARAAPAAWDYVRRLRAVVRRLAPAVVHSNGIKCHLLTRLAVPPATPVVWWVQDFYGQRPAAGRLLRAAAGRCRVALAISHAVAADVGRVLPGVPVETIHHAVDLARFAPGAGVDLDALAGLPPAAPGTVRVGLVATYARWKGQGTFLDAAAAVRAADPGRAVRFYVVGGPVYHTAAQFTEAELRGHAARSGLADAVGFVPFQPDTAGVYRALDVVVHASTLPEPFGLTVAEAMACGRAVVVSAAGGAAELFADGRDALGTPPGDAAALAAAVGRLVRDPLLRISLGAEARRTATSRFDAARLGPQFAALYERLAGR